jgi:hypothetical protein
MYGKYYLQRYKSIAEKIPNGTTVTDVCSGDSFLYQQFLRGKNKYTGVDINPLIPDNSHGAKIIKMDVVNNPIPKAEYVVIQGSLYQFIPNQKQIVDKMLQSATKKVIIAEPIINLANSNYKFLSSLSKYSVNPGTGPTPNRFTKKSLHLFFIKNYKNIIEKMCPIVGGRDMLYILNAE